MIETRAPSFALLRQGHDYELLGRWLLAIFNKDHYAKLQSSDSGFHDRHDK